MPHKQLWISGKVQGVFFRKSTQARARELGLRGWVRNLADGRVELWAEGEAAALEALERWCEAGGPPAARVDAVASGASTSAAAALAPAEDDFVVIATAAGPHTD